LIINIQTGIENKVIREVTENDIASVFGKEYMQVLTTSRIVDFMEYVALSSVQNYLPEGWSTIGIHMNIYHSKHALPGENLTCYSKLIESEGRRLVFDLNLRTQSGIIANASHTRLIINTKAFERMIKKDHVD